MLPVDKVSGDRYNYTYNELGYTFVYSYDEAGNILSKRKYPYTTGDLASPIYTYQYTYDAQNGDRLICYNGEEFEYDSKGNPTKYRGTSLAWDRVRLLERFGGHTFSYNAEGIRTRKDGITYLLDGSNILKETRANGKDILYYYDGTGVCGFRYECKDYFYAKNLQGDVTDIYGADGVKYASYTYDAWGNHTIDLDKNGIGSLNPFRYRCYYYDTETGLYYVKSRYYDPVVGRFITVDDPAVLTATPTELTDKNLYAYCDNNPVTRADYGGKFWNVVIGAVVGAVAGIVGQVISDVVTSVLNGEVTISNWQTYTGAAVGGVAGGVVLATTGNMNAANAVTGAVTTGVGQSLEKLTISNYNKSWAEIGANAVVDGAASFGLGKIPGIKGATAGRNSWSAVYKSGLTKLRNETSARMSVKVVAKGLGSSIVGGFALDGYYGVKQHAYDRVKYLLK